MKAQFVELNTPDQLEELFEVSRQKPVIIFKHSKSCPISANVLEEVAEVDSTVFFITVQDSREISDAVEARTGIRHESPQAIVLRNGKPVYSASHYDITAFDITAELVENSIK